MIKARNGRTGMAALVVLSMLIAASDLLAQFQPPGSLAALAPANIAKPRPKPPFDLTGAWLHNGNARTGGETERFDPPAGFKLTPLAQKDFDGAALATKEGKLYKNDIGLCWPAGMPIMMTRVWPVAMIQLPTAIYMISELMNSMRVVYLDGRQHTDPDIAVRSFNGESIGHWEGDTLVVDTTNFVPDHHWLHDKLGIPASDELHIVERYKMIKGGKTLEIEFTLSDPKMWVGDWKMTKHWDRADDRDIAEVECLPDLNEHMPTVHSSDNIR
ncbi:MAG TPA: hypothetical protein VGK48_13985 [Terriglobia bacterium]